MKEDVACWSFFGCVVGDVAENVRVGKFFDKFELAVLESWVKADFFDGDLGAGFLVLGEENGAERADTDC